MTQILEILVNQLLSCAMETKGKTDIVYYTKVIVSAESIEI